MKRKWHFSLVVVFLVLGLLLATSFNTQEKARKLSQTPRKQELIAKIRSLEKERDAEKARIDEQRSSLNQHQTSAAASEGNLKTYKQDLDGLRLEAGLTQVKGPGICVTLGDNPSPPGGDANNYIIHDYDLRQVVNALWIGEAEAVSINGQRLVSSSAIRCAGNTILINSNRLASPYIVSAIGDAGRMERALSEVKEANRMINEVAKTFGLITTVEKRSSVTLPAYGGSVYFEESKVREGAN